MATQGTVKGYAPSDAFKGFIASETDRVRTILTSIGLAQ
ncbi:Tricarboxylate transport protein TctC (plasmid) [Sinorhizobium fredii CCBAU 25509]|nr:Tricarboxylate transport protein TctC [Sinorhizobium fredii CCBAU 83666]AWM27988.1 Tricarboxylate transport protein TctC [Sinorhizobium fredii CCBAU 25509]